MRLLTYVSPSDRLEHVGVLDGPIVRGLPASVRMIDILGAQGHSLNDVAGEVLRDPWESVEYDGLTLCAPVPVPPSIRDFSAFREHVATCTRILTGGEPAEYWWQEPMFYFSNPAAVVASGHEVPICPGSTWLDYELEVAVVIGRDAYNVSVAEAGACIAGYMIMNDWSARDIQSREMTTSVGPAKTKDWATTLGPFLVTADELEEHRVGDRLNLEMTATVNGTPYSRGMLSDMYWSFAELISHAARGTWLRPGDVLGSGTVGTGCIMELGLVHGHQAYPWLAAGDAVTLSVTGLGEQSNRLVAGPQLRPLR